MINVLPVVLKVVIVLKGALEIRIPSHVEHAMRLSELYERVKAGDPISK